MIASVVQYCTAFYNLGWFAHIRPNRERFLKTDAAERLIPLHFVLMDLLEELPAEGELFPDVTVPVITKGFAKLRSQLGTSRRHVPRFP